MLTLVICLQIIAQLDDLCYCSLNICVRLQRKQECDERQEGAVHDVKCSFWLLLSSSSKVESGVVWWKILFSWRKEGGEGCFLRWNDQNILTKTSEWKWDNDQNIVKSNIFSDLKPWLLEVNNFPSLEPNTLDRFHNYNEDCYDDDFIMMLTHIPQCLNIA